MPVASFTAKDLDHSGSRPETYIGLKLYVGQDENGPFFSADESDAFDFPSETDAIEAREEVCSRLLDARGKAMLT